MIRILSNKIIFIVLFFLLFVLNTYAYPGIQKLRVVVLTDIENEPDDSQSLVRFLLYSNQYNIEGLIATSSIWMHRNGKQPAAWSIKETVEAYGKVRDNLLLHEAGFPTQEYLMSVIKTGSPKYGMEGVGPGQDSEGSDWLISVVDRDDPRPVWISVWGGPNTLAQALWKVSRTRTAAELKRFVEKLRVYSISDQDDSGTWIRSEFPDLFYIVSPGSYYRHATWTGISGEPFYHNVSGADTTIVGNQWLHENIIHNHGPLGEKYPEIAYAMEGDTPSFLSLINNGLNVPEHPDFGGWGGRYELYQPRCIPYRSNDNEHGETRPIWTDAQDEVLCADGNIYISNQATIWRWREAFQNDFAARMDWCVQPYRNANHPPITKVAGTNEVQMRVGEEIILDASPSSDPDSDELHFRWIHYPEAGNFWQWRGSVLKNDNQAFASFKIRKHVQLSKAKTTHIILEVTDNGNPNLTRYQRIVVNIIPGNK